MAKLPSSVEKFVKRQKTVAVPKRSKGTPAEYSYPYAWFYYPAIAALLLSGRVKPRNDELPNQTDLDRECKEANFNRNLASIVGEFFVAGEVIERNRHRNYTSGPNFDGFFSGDPKPLKSISRDAFLHLISSNTKGKPWRPTFPTPDYLLAMCAAFFGLFQGRALRWEGVGDVWREFAELPAGDLERLVKTTGIHKEIDDIDCSSWNYWLDAPGVRALHDSLGLCEWIYIFEKNGVDRFCLSETGQCMLGLKKPPQRPQPVEELQVQSDLSVLAGSGLPVRSLVTLFRYCKVKRIDRVLEFQLDKRRLREAPAGASPGEELTTVFQGLKPFPSTVKDVLQTESKQGGTVRILGCSAVVKVVDSEIEHALRTHTKLKNFIETSSPPGWLFIKESSNPNTFVQRCFDLGYEVKGL